VNRRRFENLVVELSVAAGHLVPRYALWLRLQELGLDPIGLERADMLRFVDGHLSSFLAEHGLALENRVQRRLRGRLARFDPRYPTPEETIQRLFASRP
jgi:hypothetical protein